MIKIYPNYLDSDTIDDFLSKVDYSKSLPWQNRDIPNLYSVNSIRHPSNKIVKLLGELGNVELLTYTSGSYSSPHIDDYSWGTETKWIATGILFASNPIEYEGGEFMLNNFNLTLKPPKGTLIVFPAGPNSQQYTHSVNLIKEGIRKVIVYRFIGR
jgi:predicted 2-oxoglutarate/Fe(II)-dependent dioxygenase YbiX